MASVYNRPPAMEKTMQIRFSDELIKRIDKWGVSEQMPSRSEAIRTLIERVLEASEEQTSKK